MNNCSLFTSLKKIIQTRIPNPKGIKYRTNPTRYRTWNRWVRYRYWFQHTEQLCQSDWIRSTASNDNSNIYRYRYLSAEKLFFRRYRYRYRIVIFYHSLLNIGTVTTFVPVPYRYSMFKNDLLQREYGRLVSQMERPVLAK